MTIESKINDLNAVLNNSEILLNHIDEIKNFDELEQISTLVRKVMNHLLEAQEAINDRDLDLIRYEVMQETQEASNYFDGRQQYTSLFDRREG